MSGALCVALLGCVLAVAACVQYVTGMGFSLVSVPVLALLLGPANGVALANCGAGVVSAMGLAGTWRQVRLSAMTSLIAGSACAIPLGAYAAARLPAPELLVVLGALVSAAVLLVARGARVSSLRGGHGAVVAGATSGFMNAAAGVGGPALSLYAMNADWPIQQFVPNALFYGVVVNSLSVAGNGLPGLTASAWLPAAFGIGAGSAVGRILAHRIPQDRARRAVLWLSLGGGLVVLARGLWMVVR